jgi:tetratricopeptide (TPR) repeat protein
VVTSSYEVEIAKQEHDQQRQAAHLADVRAKADAWRISPPATTILEPLPSVLYAASSSVFSLNPDETDRLAHVNSNPRQIDRAALKSLATVLHESRRLEDAIGAAPLLSAARAQLTLFEHLVVEARGPLRRRVVLLGSQYAQFTAWLHSSADQSDKAYAYYGRATEWGLEADDPNMVATALSMKGYMAYQLNQFGPMLGLSEAAGRHKRASPGVRSLAIQQEARAHALLGNGDSCDRKLDTAAMLADRAAARPDHEPPWVYFFSPDYLVMQRSRAYYYLGRYQQAEELLSFGLNTLPPAIRNAEWALTYARDLEAVRKKL